MNAADYLHIGSVSKAHGIRGEVQVTLFSGNTEEMGAYEKVFLSARGNISGPDPVGSVASGSFYHVRQARRQGKKTVVTFAEVLDRDGAEAIEGLHIWVRKTELPVLQADEFYWHELIGMRVRTVEGRELGYVESLFSTPAHDVLVIKSTEGREYLIPAKSAFIREIDRQAKVLVVVIPVEGLLEINDNVDAL